jgi:hypothetical protein
LSAPSIGGKIPGAVENPPPLPSSSDVEHLNLLAIFHYVVGGIGFLLACFPLIHLAIGIAMIAAPGVATRHGDPATAIVGYVFAGVAAFFILIGWTAAVCTIISGRLIAKRRARTFSFVTGVFLCMFMPFGTVLGVFTIILLNKESVKALYAKAAQSVPL